MKPQLAYDAIALEYGGSTVFLRPSLRAATRLERLHGGFPELLRKIEEFDTQTIRQVITAAACSEAAAPLFSYAAAQPLKAFMQACIGPVYALVIALHMIGGSDEPASHDTKPVAWADLYADLFKLATGRLGWTPETAWTATPSEILQALEGHADWMVMLHGSADDDQTSPTEEQRKQNADLGLDPEFDRAGLKRLKSLSKMREGMAL